MRNKLFILTLILILIIFNMAIKFDNSYIFQGILIGNTYAQEKAVSSGKSTPTQIPDGLVGDSYKFVIVPKEYVSPYKITLKSGKLPPGLNINDKVGSIEGKPTQAGRWEFVIEVVDAKEKKMLFSGVIYIWRRVITVGENGSLKEFNGIQIALNMAKDLDEIRIEKGTYLGTGLIIPGNKIWDYGIKISGGWDETFKVREENPEATIFDGNEEEGLILNKSNAKGIVFVENLTFRNSKGGGVEINGGGNVIFTNCNFTNNLKAGDGAAVRGDGTFNNCIFQNNSTVGIFNSGNGGAVFGYGIFNNCTFRNNSAEDDGGAVCGGGTFSNCTFYNNIADNGGAVIEMIGKNGIFDNCIFENNSATKGFIISNGGAVCGGGTFTNCTFRNNSAKEGGAVYGNGIFTNCTFSGNSAREIGGAVKGDGIYANCKFNNNSAERGGAVYGNGTFANCTFNSNSAENGGAICSIEESNFVNCLFVNNSAKEGGAIIGKDDLLFNLTTMGRCSLFNCTLYGNKAEEDGGAIKGWGEILNSIFYNNIAKGKLNDITSIGDMVIDYSLVNYIKGPVDYGENNKMGDPKFVDPLKGDFSLRPDSPCIDAGIIPKNIEIGSLDLAGKPRIVGSKIDMGAYEFQGKRK